jgi:endo-1,4-beta-xylanase
MKFRNIIPIIILVATFLTSCRDQIMEWGKDPSHGEITSAELPLQLAEKISRYAPLKNYTDFKLGIGMDLSEYMNIELYRNIVNENFDEITVGYAMKHGAMVKANGALDFTSVDALITELTAAGLSVYGHTLCWHANQNASYLNGLIAPTVIPAPAGSNSLDLSGLNNGNFAGWTKANVGAGITVENGTGLSASAKAVKLISSATAANPWDLQLITPDITIVNGHNYQVSFYIRSEQPGKGRLSFTGLTNNYPWKDWYATGGSWTEAFTTSSTWQQVKIPVNDFVAAGTSFKINFDLGYLPDVTYYIDVDNIQVIDLDAPPVVLNLITNGDFEGGTLSPWNGWGNSSTRAVSANGEGYGGTGYAMVLTNPTAANNYSAQQVYTFSSPLEQGKEYTCTFWIKASTAAVLQLEIQSADYSANYYGGINVGTTWTQVQKTITPTTADRTKFIFDFGETACTYDIDDIVFTSGAGPSGPTIIEKTPAEKKTIIEAALADWISKMVTHYKDKVHAWDVVNEPMLENGTLRNGNVADIPADNFYWVKYIGQDYAVQAFNLARQYGNPGDKLFINDYNLEYSLAKCDGLITFVAYIESQGATVDGIGTQMHLSLTSDRDKIVQMFQKLAATGKLIKISEFDVRLGTANPTIEQLAQQSDMYQYVIDMYMQYIPQAQRYGITVWGVSDNAMEHVNWLPNESPDLWDANYLRKYAYKGFADGLAGRDVSVDFSGELEY